MKTTIMRITVVSVLGVSLGACSVAMASKKKGVDVQDIMDCQNESCLLSLKDTEELKTQESEEGKIVTYRSLQKQGSTGRAVMHGLLDVATLGIWEIAGTPIEASKNNDKFYVYSVTYDQEGNVVKASIDGAN
ncbi:MAG: hypothetical protein ACE5EM_00545 [Sphingomonadales bacterium]